MSSKILSIYDLLSGYCGVIKRRAKRRVVDLTANELDTAARAAFGKAARESRSINPLPLHPTSKSIAVKVTLNERTVVEDYIWVWSAEQLATLGDEGLAALKTDIQNKFSRALNEAVLSIRLAATDIRQS